MYRGYIKLWRKIKSSFIWQNSEIVHLFIHLLLSVNHEDKEFLFNGKKQVCSRGQIITSRKKLADETQINENNVYRFLQVLKNEHLIEQQKNNRFTLITIVKYDDYQSNEQQNEQPVNNQLTTSEQPANTTKECRRIKKKDNIYIAAKKPPRSEESIKGSQVQACFEFFMSLYKTKNERRYVPKYGKDKKLIKQVLNQLGYETTIKLMEDFFKSEDAFIKKAGDDIGIWFSQINKLNSIKDEGWQL